jgi:hypothetical protein
MQYDGAAPQGCLRCADQCSISKAVGVFLNRASAFLANEGRLRAEAKLSLAAPQMVEVVLDALVHQHKVKRHRAPPRAQRAPESGLHDLTPGSLRPTPLLGAVERVRLNFGFGTPGIFGFTGVGCRRNNENRSPAKAKGRS